VCVFWVSMVTHNGEGLEIRGPFSWRGGWKTGGCGGKKTVEMNRKRSEEAAFTAKMSRTTDNALQVRLIVSGSLRSPRPFLTTRLPSLSLPPPSFSFSPPINLTKFQLFVRSMLNERLPIANVGC